MSDIKRRQSFKTLLIAVLTPDYRYRDNLELLVAYWVVQLGLRLQNYSFDNYVMKQTNGRYDHSRQVSNSARNTRSLPPKTS